MAQLLSDEILEMTLQSLQIEDKRSIRLVCKRFKRIVDWSIKICIVLGKTNDNYHSSSSSSSCANSSAVSSRKRGKDAELYYPSKYQYVTCISIAGECKELQEPGSGSASISESPTQSTPPNPENSSDCDLPPDVYQFPIKFEPLALFSHCKLRRLVIGQGVSGLSPSFISRILRYSCSNLEKLGWNIDVSERRKGTNCSRSHFLPSSTSNETETPSSFLKGLDFKNLTELSLKLVQKPGRGENTRAFLSLLQNHFPKLYSLSLVLISEPITIFTVRNSDIKAAEEGLFRYSLENSRTNCQFQYENAWPVYFETFYFISKHSRSLRVLELDYSHLNLETLEAPELDSNSDSDHWHWKKLGKIERIKEAFEDLELHTLDLVCPKMEGISPWNLCSSLFSSQRHLNDLMLKTRGNPHLLLVDSTLSQNKNLENLYFSNPDNWNDPNFYFDFSSIALCDKLKSLEVNYCSGFLNAQDIPISLRKLKLRSIFTLQDLSDLLQNCPYLRKLHLHNDGNFWREVSVDTVKTILEHGTCLRKVFMDNFDTTSVQEYCKDREDLRLAVLKRNKGRLKIRRGNCDKKISTSLHTNKYSNTSSTFRSSSNSSPSTSRSQDGTGDGENSENEKHIVQSREEQIIQELEEQQQQEGTCSTSNSNFNSMSVSAANSLASDENCLQDPR